MKMIFTDERQKKMVIDNMGLVYSSLKSFGVSKYSANYDEYVSNGTFGLIKAVLTYDLSRNNTFSTYALRCIKNEILMGIRKNKKWNSLISIYEEIPGNEKILVKDMLVDSKSNFDDNVIKKIEIIQAVNIILNCLEGLQRWVILSRLGGILQEDIAKELGCSQSAVSKFEKRAIKKVRDIYNNENVKYKKIFTMKIVGSEYKIFFLPKDISKFNMVHAKILEKQNQNFIRVSSNNGRIEISVHACEEFYVHIADIIGEIDGIHSVTTKILTNNSEDKRKVIIIEKEKVINMHDVKNYLLTLDTFSSKELKKKFPEIPNAIINNAIVYAKKKELIVRIARGVYRVKKIK